MLATHEQSWTYSELEAEAVDILDDGSHAVWKEVWKWYE
jgi:hypothetical protein